MPTIAAATTNSAGDKPTKADNTKTIVKSTRVFLSTMDLFQSRSIAFRISTQTHTRMPAKAFFTIAKSAKFCRKAAIIVIIPIGKMCIRDRFGRVI